MKKDFNKLAEDWANEEIKKIAFQPEEDFINSVILGLPIAYKYDKNGNYTKLTINEILELKSKPNIKETEITPEEIIKRYKL